MSDRDGSPDMYFLDDGTVISNTHPPSDCADRATGCPLHDPSAHPLRDAPLVSFAATGGLGRRCRHGQDHPDVDDIAWRYRGDTLSVQRQPRWVHEPCDGCCGLDQSAWVAPA